MTPKRQKKKKTRKTPLQHTSNSSTPFLYLVLYFFNPPTNENKHENEHEHEHEHEDQVENEKHGYPCSIASVDENL